MKKRSKFLVFGEPDLQQAEIDEVVVTLKSRWWGTGAKVKKFEERFARYASSKHSLALNSATAGLHLALKVLGISPGDEVITTPMTFCATANVIVHCGAKPIFADIDREDWNIDPQQIEKKITKKTKAIIPVHLHGRPCKMDRIMALARKHRLFVVEDAAHAIEAQYKGKKVGSIGDITAFSFYVTKNVATGEGGMATTNRKDFADQMRTMSLHGLSQDAYMRYSTKAFRRYEVIVPGYKYNMMDIQAAIGLHQFARISSNAVIRKKYWSSYQKAFEKIDEIVVPKPGDPETVHARHLYAILLMTDKLKISRDEFIDNLIKMNIGSGVHFYPVHLHPYYRETFGYNKGDFSRAEFVGNRIISLPLGVNLKENDVEDVIGAVLYLVKKFKK